MNTASRGRHSSEEQLVFISADQDMKSGRGGQAGTGRSAEAELQKPV